MKRGIEVGRSEMRCGRKRSKEHFAPTELEEWTRRVSINIALLRSEKQSPCIVAGDIFMTESGQTLRKDLAGNLHAFRSLVTRAAAISPKLASVDENWIARRMIMKRILMLATVVLLLTLGAGTALAQSGYDLFQKALVKERAVGDVEEALRLYQRIVKEFGSNHALAAKAELRMGLLYDRLGRKADAQRAYQAVVSQYSDQTNEARQARANIVV